MSGPSASVEIRPRDRLRSVVVLALGLGAAGFLAWLLAGEDSPARIQPAESAEAVDVNPAVAGAQRGVDGVDSGLAKGSAADGNSANDALRTAEAAVSSEEPTAEPEVPADRIVITARILHPDRQRPMPGVRVLLTRYRLSDRFEKRVLTHAERQPVVRTTNAEGRARFDLAVDEDSEYRGVVYFTAPGFEAEPIPLYSIESGAAIDLRDVVMRASSGGSPGGLDMNPKATNLLRLIEAAKTQRVRAVREGRRRRQERR